MAPARDAPAAARLTALLLGAVATACLLAAVLGWRTAPQAGGLQGMNAAGVPVAALLAPASTPAAAEHQAGTPAPQGPAAGMHGSARAELDPESGRATKPAPLSATARIQGGPPATAPRLARVLPPLPARAARSHLSQAPPARA